MNPREIKSDYELYQYLILLEVELRKCGQLDAAAKVISGGRFVNGVPATEFLYEAYVALLNVKDICKNSLLDVQYKDFESVLQQLATALKTD